jgi:hypothetical protein
MDGRGRLLRRFGVVADSHHFDEEQDPTRSRYVLSEKSDPDPHKSESRIRIRIEVKSRIRIRIQ